MMALRLIVILKGNDMNGYESYIIDSGTTFSLMESLRRISENVLMVGIITGLIANGISGLFGYIMGKRAERKRQIKLGEEVNRLNEENDKLKEALGLYKKVKTHPGRNYITFPKICSKTAFCPFCWKDRKEQEQMVVKSTSAVGLLIKLECRKCGNAAEQRL